MRMQVQRVAMDVVDAVVEGIHLQCAEMKLKCGFLERKAGLMARIWPPNQSRALSMTDCGIPNG